MQHALKSVPERALEPTEGVVRSGPYWIFDEFAHGRGVGSVGLEDKVPQPASDDERKGILDLFRR